MQVISLTLKHRRHKVVNNLFLNIGEFCSKISTEKKHPRNLIVINLGRIFFKESESDEK